MGVLTLEGHGISDTQSDGLLFYSPVSEAFVHTNASLMRKG